MTATARVMDGKKVLLVDDDADLRATYATTLRHQGYCVVEASSMKEAEAAVRAGRPDAVVLDCRLPDGDGLTLVNRWRGSEMGRVPVILLTAHRERHDVDAAFVAGADLFVPKPCPSSVLAAYVTRAITAAAPTRRLRAAV